MPTNTILESPTYSQIISRVFQMVRYKFVSLDQLRTNLRTSNQYKEHLLKQRPTLLEFLLSLFLSIFFVGLLNAKRLLTVNMCTLNLASNNGPVYIRKFCSLNNHIIPTTTMASRVSLDISARIKAMPTLILEPEIVKKKNCIVKTFLQSCILLVFIYQNFAD